MATLSPEQLDELVLHLVIRRSYAERGSAEANAAEAALEKLFAQYPEAQHLAEDHVSNIPAGYD
jgi:hypothetical protein